MLGERPRLSRSSTAIPATTSSFHELMKLNNVNECIYDALRTQANVMRDIERILASEQEHTTEILTAKNAPLTTREPLDAVNEARRQIKKLKTSISSARSTLEARRAAIESGTRSIHSSQASLNADDESIRTLEAEHTATKPVLKSQIRRIASTFLDILPIQPIPGAPLHFTIAGLYLPSAAAFSRSTSPSNLSASTIPPMDEDATAAALGHAVLIINCLATYLCIPLPFELFPQGSTSAVFDPLTSATQLGIPETSRPTSPNPSASDADHERLAMNPPTPTTAPSRLFALTQRGTPVARFAWAVYLVNKDLEELMGAVGLKVVDPRATVANLKYLLEVLAVEKAGVGLGKREGGVVRGLKGGG
jgi:UV radiation resistance-associated gene protein